MAVAASLQDPAEDGTVLSAYEESVVDYSSDRDLADPIHRLRQLVENGSLKLDYDEHKGYLPALLKALDVPVSSQLLVFSKTSSQAPFTSPKTPRALYFNDTVFVGWAQGSGVIDLTAIDPKKGPIFYVLEQSRLKPKFERRLDCISCHIGPKTLDVPGLVVRSVYTEPNGDASAMVDGFVSGHNNPLRQRWGGWYVTGEHGSDVHMGNAFFKESQHASINLKGTSNWTTLDDQFDTSKYLTPHSDAVALLVLDHAVRMQVYFTRARYETLFAQDEIKRKPDDKNVALWSDDRIRLAGEELLAYLLFRDEAPLHGPISGTSGFERDFLANGPRDSKGRSLREFDLVKRVFKYPCSYLIYSDSFQEIPDPMKGYLWKRLDEILTGRDRGGLYAGMDDSDRRAVLEILTDTLPAFRDWRKANARR